MDDGAGTLTATEEYYTLLCVRRDGVAPFVDMVASEDFGRVRRRAEFLLREHRSCDKVEVWRDGALLEELERA